MLLGTGRATLKGSAYLDRVLGIDYANLIGYWPMDETSGSVAYDRSSQGNNGVYTGVTLGQPGIGDGRTCPLFDGVNDYLNLYSAGFIADYAQAELSVQIWFKVFNAAIWEDATVRKLFRFFVDNDNTLKAERSLTNNQLDSKVEGNTTSDYEAWTGNSAAAWQHLMITISESNDRIFLYGNGLQVDTDTGLGTWAGPLTLAMIGVLSAGGSHPWKGWLAHCAIWTAERSAADAEALAAP